MLDARYWILYNQYPFPDSHSRESGNPERLDKQVSFSQMPDEDVKAIYRYLQTLEPVYHNLEKYVYAPGEEF